VDAGTAEIAGYVAKGATLGISLDGYQTTGRKHFTGIMLHANGHTVPFDEILQGGDVHHGIAVAKEIEEAIYMVQTSTNMVIGSVCTDDAGQCARARRILALRFRRIVFTKCFAHQVQHDCYAQILIRYFINWPTDLEP